MTISIPRPITAAVTYIAASIQGGDGDIRKAADSRVKEIVAAKVTAMLNVNHDFSPALPRNACHYKPHREFIASAEIFVFTRSELESLLNGRKSTDTVSNESTLDESS